MLLCYLGYSAGRVADAASSMILFSLKCIHGLRFYDDLNFSKNVCNRSSYRNRGGGIFWRFFLFCHMNVQNIKIIVEMFETFKRVFLKLRFFKVGELYSSKSTATIVLKFYTPFLLINYQVTLSSFLIFYNYQRIGGIE